MTSFDPCEYSVIGLTCLVDTLGWRNRLTIVLIQGVANDISVIQPDWSTKLLLVRQGVLHPFSVVSVRVVISSMGTSRFRSSSSRGSSLSGTSQQVLQLQSLDQVGVPDHGSVGGLDMLEGFINFVDVLDTFVQSFLGSEHSTSLLHGLLHGQSNLGSGLGTVGVSQLIKVGDGVQTKVLRNRLERSTWGQGVSDGVGDGSTENNQVQQRVGTQSVSTVNGGTGNFTTSQQARNNFILALLVLLEHLTGPSGWNTTHVVVDGRQDRDRLLGHVDTSENVGGLRNTRQSFLQHRRRDVRQLQEHVVLFWADTSTFVDFHGDGTGNNVSGGQVLGVRSVTLHETLTLGVDQVTTFTSGTLSDQAARAVDTRRVELHKLQVLQRQASSRGHGVTVTGTGVGGGTGEVGSTVTTSGQHGLVGAETVQSTVLLVVGHHTDTLAVLHHQVHGEELNEKVRVVSQGLAVQRVQQGVAGSVGHGTRSVGLATFTVLLRLATKSTLVDTAFLVSGKGHTVVLQLVDGLGRLLGHVVDGVLVTQPVRTLDGVVHVPVPVVLVHVSQRRIDSALGGHGVGSGGEQLGDTGGFEAGLGQAESCSKTSTTGANNHTVVLVVNDMVLLAQVFGGVDSFALGGANDLAGRSGGGKRSEASQHGAEKNG